MSTPCRIILAGLGNYGNFYLSALLDEAQSHNVKLVAIVDPLIEKDERAPQFREAGIVLSTDFATCLETQEAELCVLVTPISLHAEQTRLALEGGLHVLCEKPLAAVTQDGRVMQAAARAASTHVAIGYQWSFASAIQHLKRDIQAGVFGKPIRLRTLQMPPRGYEYYGRNAWAGHLRDERGEWVLDSPLSNATAHYLHNSLYVCGTTQHTSATPVSITAELYRANAITNCDTATVRVITDDNVEILHYCSHAVPSDLGFIFVYEFEDATILYGGEWGEGEITARMKDGSIRNYGNPSAGPYNKLWQMVEATRGGEPPVCGVDAAIPHLLCVNGAQESVDAVTEFPAARVYECGAEKKRQLAVKGLSKALVLSFSAGLLPSEVGHIDWAVPGKPVSLRHYTEFPSKALPYDVDR